MKKIKNKPEIPTKSAKSKVKVMDKVKIKRVKRNKKKVTTAEKIMAGIGVGSTLMGGAGIAAGKTSQTQFVRTNETGASSATQKVKAEIGKIFGSTLGVGVAKAAALETDNTTANTTASQVSVNDVNAAIASGDPSQVTALLNQSSTSMTSDAITALATYAANNQSVLPTTLVGGSALAYATGSGADASATASTQALGYTTDANGNLVLSAPASSSSSNSTTQSSTSTVGTSTLNTGGGNNDSSGAATSTTSASTATVGTSSLNTGGGNNDTAATATTRTATAGSTSPSGFGTATTSGQGATTVTDARIQQIISGSSTLSYGSLTSDEQTALTAYLSSHPSALTATNPSTFAPGSVFAWALGTGTGTTLNASAESLGFVAYSSGSGVFVKQAAASTITGKYTDAQLVAGINTITYTGSSDIPDDQLIRVGPQVASNTGPVTPGTVLAYILGLGADTPAVGTTRDTSSQNIYKFDGTNWVKQGSSTSSTNNPTIANNPLNVGNLNTTKYDPLLNQDILALNLTVSQKAQVPTSGVVPGNVLAYMLGLGGDYPAQGTTRVASDGNNYKFDSVSNTWSLAQVSTGYVSSTQVGALSFTTGSGNTTTPKVGDTWKVSIVGAQPNSPVFLSGGINGGSAKVQEGTTDANGNFTLTSSSAGQRAFSSADVGSWSETWSVGTNILGSFSFNVQAPGGTSTGSGNNGGGSVDNTGGSTAATVKTVSTIAASNAAPVTQTAVVNNTTSGGGSSGSATLLAPAFITTTLPGGVVGGVYTGTIQISSYSPAVFSLASGTLPPALTLSSNGVIDGLLTTPGTYTFTIRATNQPAGVALSTTQTYTITITGSGSSGGGTISGQALGTELANLNTAPAFVGLQMPAGYPASGGGLQMPSGYAASNSTSGQVAGAQVTGQAYTVKKGDTLTSISRKFYGNGSNWRKILAANPNSLAERGNTKTLKIGAQLVIPSL